jgi:predicted small metal-binding protein
MRDKKITQLSASGNDPGVLLKNSVIDLSVPSAAPPAWQGTHTHGDRAIRCADAVYKDCGWSVTGNNEEDILGYLRAHARRAHGKNEFTPQELANARRAIHKRAA